MQMMEEGHGLSNKDAREGGQSPMPQLVANAQLEIEVRGPRQHGHDRLLEPPADTHSLLPNPRPRSPPKETLFDCGRSDAHLRQIPGIVVELLPEAAPEPVRRAAHSGHLMGGSSQVPKVLRTRSCAARCTWYKSTKSRRNPSLDSEWKS